MLTSRTHRWSSPQTWAVLALLVLPLAASAQGKRDQEKAPKAPKSPGADTAAPKVPNPRLFRSELPFDITLTLNMKQIRRDKQQNAPWRWARISYTDAAGKPVTVPVRAKTRGVWRLKHCDFPPLRLKFGDKTADGTEFANLDEPKMVGYCRNTTQYEQYNLHEAQLYRIYRQVTDLSHKIRVLRIAYADSATGQVETTRYGFIIEDPAHLAARAGGRILDRKGATAEDLDPPTPTCRSTACTMGRSCRWPMAGTRRWRTTSTSPASSMPTTRGLIPHCPSRACVRGSFAAGVPTRRRIRPCTIPSGRSAQPSRRCTPTPLASS